jgi:hypothetical protein
MQFADDRALCVASAAHGRVVWESKHVPNFDPAGLGVDSTARNCRILVRKRVADCKHGFKSGATGLIEARSPGSNDPKF